MNKQTTQILDAYSARAVTAVEHDLFQLSGHRPRSHSGRGEQRVPFLLSLPLTAPYRDMASGWLRNFYIYDFALKGVAT
jgi:phosphonoacetate hydrolase